MQPRPRAETERWRRLRFCTACFSLDVASQGCNNRSTTARVIRQREACSVVPPRALHHVMSQGATLSGRAVVALLARLLSGMAPCRWGAPLTELRNPDGSMSWGTQMRADQHRCDADRLRAQERSSHPGRHPEAVPTKARTLGVQETDAVREGPPERLICGSRRSGSALICVPPRHGAVAPHGDEPRRSPKTRKENRSGAQPRAPRRQIPTLAPLVRDVPQSAHPLLRLSQPRQPGDDLRHVVFPRARVHDRHSQHAPTAEVGGGDPSFARTVVALAQ